MGIFSKSQSHDHKVYRPNPPTEAYSPGRQLYEQTKEEAQARQSLPVTQQLQVTEKPAYEAQGAATGPKKKPQKQQGRKTLACCNGSIE